MTKGDAFSYGEMRTLGSVLCPNQINTLELQQCGWKGKIIVTQNIRLLRRVRLVCNFYSKNTNRKVTLTA